MFSLIRRLLHGTAFQNTRLFEILYSSYVAVLQRNLPSDGKSVLVDFRDSTFWIQKGDITILPTLIKGTYETDEFDQVLALSKQCDVFIDVGANIGLYTILCAKTSSLSTKIYAIEPNSAALDLLIRNLSQLSNTDRQKVTTHQIAVSDRVGLAQFELSRFHGTSKLAPFGSPKTIEVRVSTLDSILLDSGTFPDRTLIKIDVEGFEPNVIKGASNFLKAKRPRLFIEICGKSSRAVHCDWREAISILDATYTKMQIWGPLRNSVGSDSRLSTCLELLLADGRLHNVLIES